MKIYTKTGDEGKTSLFGGTRLSKADLRIESYGTIDELNSHLGLLRDQAVNAPRKDLLINIQETLFTIGSMLAAEPGNDKIKVPVINGYQITPHAKFCSPGWPFCRIYSAYSQNCLPKS
jgi:cob(I)alamin adenosyltransferase